MKWKLKEKLKKLRLNKPYFFKYKIITSKTNFINKKYQGYNIIENDNQITFYCYKLSDEIEHDENCLKEKIWKNKFNYIIKEKSIILVGLILIGLSFIASNFLVRDIVFLNESYYNHEVYSDVKKHLNHLGPFYYLDYNINELSKDLREKYYDYAYIGINKKGAKLIIEIEKQEEYEHLKEDEVIGDLIACKDGKIVGIEVERGVVVVQTSQIISKGDLLVSCNLSYLTNPANLTNLVSAKGNVYASTIEYQKIEISKQEKYEYYTRNFEEYYQIIINKKIINKKNPAFNSSYTKKQEVFRIGSLFTLNHIAEYEKKEVVVNYSCDEALEVAKEKISKDFEEKRVSSFERINYIQLIEISETKENYNFSFLVRTVENIAIKRKHEG